jgi:hypothetical protein
MTFKIGDIVYIQEEAEGRCELCGRLDELRPYGPNNERICFDCAMKDKETTARKFREFMDGPGEHVQ